MGNIYVYKDPKENILKVFYPDYENIKIRNLNIDDVLKKAIPEGVKYRETTKDKLPKSRDFREAWTDDLPTDTVDVDMSKARKIKMTQIREDRDAKLESLDAEYLKALEKGDTKVLDAVALNKQQLRDLPQTVNLDVIKTPDELKTFVPKELL